MKKIVSVISIAFIFIQVLSAQLSFSEKRVRDNTLNEGIAFIHQRQFEQAAARFTRCLDLDSTFAPAYLQRGRIFIEWGLMDDAMADLDMAIFYDPELGEAYFYKGYILFDNDSTYGDPTVSDAAMFDAAISHGFTEAWAYYFRGLTRIREGKDGMAMNDFNAAIVKKVDFALAYHERAGVKRRGGDLQGAHFDYQTAIEYQPRFPLAYNNRGSVRILLGDYEGAISDYSMALEQDAELFIALNNRGYAYYYLGNTEKALEDFNSAIALNDQFVNAYINKSSLLAKQSEVITALSLLDGVIREHADDALLYLNRGLIRELTGDLKGACKDWKRAKELGAGEAENYITQCNK